jgi:hypothetical protein
MLCHMIDMLGHIDFWFYQEVAGINGLVQGKPHEKRAVLIRPQVLGEMTYASAHHVFSHEGRVNVYWSIDESRITSPVDMNDSSSSDTTTFRRFNLELDVPVQLDAIVHLPCSDIGSVTEGGVQVSALSWDQDGVTLEFFDEVHQVAVFRVVSGHFSFSSLYAEK